MKKKLAFALTVAFVGLTTLSAKSAFSGDLSCSDWSYNTSGCSAHIERTDKVQASVAVQNNNQQLACSDWSYNTPGCSAHIERTNKAPANVVAQNNNQQFACSDWSYNTPGCSAHID